MAVEPGRSGRPAGPIGRADGDSPLGGVVARGCSEAAGRGPRGLAERSAKQKPPSGLGDKSPRTPRAAENEAIMYVMGGRHVVFNSPLPALPLSFC
jgi:hypothetical protein